MARRRAVYGQFALRSNRSYSRDSPTRLYARRQAIDLEIYSSCTTPSTEYYAIRQDIVHVYLKLVQMLSGRQHEAKKQEIRRGLANANR